MSKCILLYLSLLNWEISPFTIQQALDSRISFSLTSQSSWLFNSGWNTRIFKTKKLVVVFKLVCSLSMEKTNLCFPHLIVETPILVSNLPSHIMFFFFFLVIAWSRFDGLYRRDFLTILILIDTSLG